MSWFKRLQAKTPQDLLMPWDDFKAGIENPATYEAIKARTLGEIANGPRYRDLTYDPFTFQSRIYGPNGRYGR